MKGLADIKFGFLLQPLKCSRSTAVQHINLYLTTKVPEEPIWFSGNFFVWRLELQLIFSELCHIPVGYEQYFHHTQFSQLRSLSYLKLCM